MGCARYIDHLVADRGQAGLTAVRRIDGELANSPRHVLHATRPFTSGRSLLPANAPHSRPPHGNCKLPFEPICYAGTHCKLSPNEMEQVVATPELVDMIFAHMSRQENTATALVCKSWLEHSRDHIWCEVLNPKELFCLLVPLKTAPDLVRRSFLMAERLLT